MLVKLDIFFLKWDFLNTWRILIKIDHIQTLENEVENWISPSFSGTGMPAHLCRLTWQGGCEDRCTESSHWLSQSPSHSTRGHTHHNGHQWCDHCSPGVPDFKRREKQWEMVRNHPYLVTVKNYCISYLFHLLLLFLILKGEDFALLNHGNIASSLAFVHYKTAFIQYNLEITNIFLLWKIYIGQPHFRSLQYESDIHSDLKNYLKHTDFTHSQGLMITCRDVCCPH